MNANNQHDTNMFELLRVELIALETGVAAGDIRPESHLVDDLGLDSLMLPELTTGLERAIGVDEFPMQAWIDEQREHGRPLTVGSLAQACEALMNHSAARPNEAHG